MPTYAVYVNGKWAVKLSWSRYGLGDRDHRHVFQGQDALEAGRIADSFGGNIINLDQEQINAELSAKLVRVEANRAAWVDEMVRASLQSPTEQINREQKALIKKQVALIERLEEHVPANILAFIKDL